MTIISDGGSDFFNMSFKALLEKFGIRHKVATPYLPQTSGQVKVSNKEIKKILAKIVIDNRTDWSNKLHDALRAYQTAYKTPIELEHEALWAMKKLNMDCGTASNQRIKNLNILDEFLLKAYESSALYKEKMMRLRLFPGKLNSKWTGPFLLTNMLPHRAVVLENSQGTRFMVNGQRIKIYLGNAEFVQEVVEAYHLNEV
ncbi:uncharacterized protein LOC125861434 [Solanum stenotomum]|uniref:uncharacterized protein LOC125861434 n=1 Tax=Solanum stenotomum TaxID=172797 RepID=UPI0020D0BEE9|nr:uncharacterized protein LOC125861434 [Solanum stenotomum]